MTKFLLDMESKVKTPTFCRPGCQLVKEGCKLKIGHKQFWVFTLLDLDLKDIIQFLGLLLSQLILLNKGQIQSLDKPDF